jgi:hypothetical protein
MRRRRPASAGRQICGGLRQGAAARASRARHAQNLRVARSVDAEAESLRLEIVPQIALSTPKALRGHRIPDIALPPPGSMPRRHPAVSLAAGIVFGIWVSSIAVLATNKSSDAAYPHPLPRDFNVDLLPTLAALAPIEQSDLELTVYRSGPIHNRDVANHALMPDGADVGATLGSGLFPKNLSLTAFARTFDVDVLPPVTVIPDTKDGIKLASYGPSPAITANPAVPIDDLDSRISRAGHVNTKCIPRALKRVLNQIVARHGPIYITSTHRSSARNRRVGGARNSLHLRCRAVDFKFHGGNRSRLLSFLKSHPSVGGVGNYGSRGHIHIDDGPTKRW